MASHQPLPDRAAVAEVDCAVVGGGAAGLSAAINLARMRRSVLLVDERDRFLWRHRVNNYLGFPEGIAASDIRRLGWRQALRFDVRLLIGHVASAERRGAGFELSIKRLPADGVWSSRPDVPRDAEMAGLFEEVPEPGPLTVIARSVVLATGVLGHFPEFAGRDECVGISLFWCIHCDGYESTGKTVAVVGDDEESVETALGMLDFTERVALIAGPTGRFAVPESRLSEVAREGIAVHACAVAEYRHSGGQMQALVLDDGSGTTIPVEHVYTVCRSKATNEMARQLGLALDRNGQVVVDTSQQTNVPGVYAAGDVTSLHNHQLSAAVHEGNEAAASANYFLYRPVQKSPQDAG